MHHSGSDVQMKAEIGERDEKRGKAEVGVRGRKVLLEEDSGEKRRRQRDEGRMKRWRLEG